jgi:uncharacterized RDD family membrane protein YckC
MISSDKQLPMLADSGNRAVALLLDLILLAFLAGTFAGYLDAIRQVFVPLLFLIYFAAMPLTKLQGTLGKWICRIKICDRQGNRLGWRASLIRALATIGWFALPLVVGELLSNAAYRHRATEIWWLLFLLPWASIGFMPRRESLIDLLAGSIVVRYKATPEDIRSFEPIHKHKLLNGVGMALLCLFVGFVFSTTTEMQQTRNLYSRIAYAIGETRELRKRIEQFRDAEKRWPDSMEMGIPDWNPYPDGGGYRLQPNGNVVISFSVLPELKGRSITFAPKLAGNGQIDWQCTADPEIERRYLPSSCR